MNDSKNPNKEITSPAGTRFEIRSFLTGFEQRAYRKLLNGLDDSDDVSKIDGIEDLFIKTYVVSVDGKTFDTDDEKIKYILEKPSTEVNFVVSNITEMINDSLGKKNEETLNGSTSDGSEGKAQGS